MIVLQLLLYCLLFTAMVKIAVIGGAVNGLYFYPKEVQDRAIELGLIDRNTMNWKRKCFIYNRSPLKNIIINIKGTSIL